MNRDKWTCAVRAMHKMSVPEDNPYISGVLFIGTQAGCAQAAKDCQVPTGHFYMVGLNKGQYQLASTGKVKPKLLKMDLYGRAQVY